MARNNLFRLLSSISEFSTPKLSDSLTRSVSSSATRFLCAATQQPQAPGGEDSNRESDESPKLNPEVQKQETEDGEEEYDEEGVHINKKTGEVGGPRGPEPTRYGDWERAGRCYDF